VRNTKERGTKESEEQKLRKNRRVFEETLSVNQCNLHLTVNMSEIAVNAGESVTSQVIEDMPNVNLDKMAKLSALKTETGDSPTEQVEVTNGESEVHLNGTTQNGDKTGEPTKVTSSGDASNPTVSEPSAESTLEAPVEASGTGTGTESSNLIDEAKPEEQSNSEPTTTTSEDQNPQQSNEDGKTETPCDTTESTSETQSPETVPRSSESAESPAKDITAEGQTEGDEVTIKKKMEELKVDSESKKDSSPAKKSCSPF